MDLDECYKEGHLLQYIFTVDWGLFGQCMKTLYIMHFALGFNPIGWSYWFYRVYLIGQCSVAGLHDWFDPQGNKQ